MKNLKNVDSRQVPKIIDICSNKEYHDILYGYLQEHSEWDGIQGHPRYIDKKLINFSKLGSAINLSRQTVSKRFQNLIDLGLISAQPDSKGKYYLSILPADVAALIPVKTLRLLVDVFQERVISIYVHLLMRYIANGQHPFNFYLSELKNFVGICTTTRSNNDIVLNVLYVLQKIGLIQYEMIAAKEMNGDFTTKYQLNFLTNEIDS